MKDLSRTQILQTQPKMFKKIKSTSLNVHAILAAIPIWAHEGNPLEIASIYTWNAAPKIG